MEEALYLQEEIIHHILSYLNPEEKLQAALLSKEWWTAWQTNPKLEFDARDFISFHHFYKHVETTLARYQEGHIQEVSLPLNPDGTNDNFNFVLSGIFELALRKNVKLVRLVVTGTGCDKNYAVIESIPQVPQLLMDICFRSCKLEKKDNPGDKFRYNLRSLHLEKVYIDYQMFSCFMSGGCPMISCLTMDCVQGLETIELINLQGLKKVKLINLSDLKTIKMINLGSLEELRILRITSEKLTIEIDAPNLERMYLVDAYITDAFFEDFEEKFPRLEFLKVDSCPGFKKISLRSHQLKHLQLTEETIIAIFAPNLVRFDYGGIISPSIARSDYVGDIRLNHPLSLTFTPFLSQQYLNHPFSFSGFLSQQCVCNILIKCTLTSRDLNPTSWFLKLRQFLSSLSPSKVLLHIQLIPWSVTSPRQKSDFLDRLFSTCRPKTILMYWVNGDSQEFIKFLYEKLITERRKGKLINWPCAVKSWEHDLKNVEFVIPDVVHERLGKEYCQDDTVDLSHLHVLGLIFGSEVLFRLEWDVCPTSPIENQESEALKPEIWSVGNCSAKLFDCIRNLFESFLRNYWYRESNIYTRI